MTWIRVIAGIRWITSIALLTAGFTVGAAVMLGTSQIFADTSSRTHYACVNRYTGQLRYAYTAERCTNAELLIEWNQQGPQGPQGEQGPQGMQGPQGESGIASAQSCGPGYGVVGISENGLLECAPLAATSLRDCSELDPLTGATDFQNCVNPRVPRISGVSGVDYSGALFQTTSVDHAELVGVPMTGSAHVGARYSESDFSQADLRNVYLYSMRLDESIAIGMDMSGSFGGELISINSNLDEVSFRNASFRRLTLIDSTAEYADFTGSSISAVYFENSSLLGASFQDVTSLPSGGIWTNTICPDGSNSDDDDGDGFTCYSNLTPAP